MCSKTISPAVYLLACAGFLLCQSAGGQAPCHTDEEFASVKHLLQKKDYDGAAAVLNRLKECGGLSPLQMFEIGWLYGRARHFPEALGVFQSVPVDVPDRPSHTYAVALSQFELAHYKDAVKVLRTLEAENGLDPESANLLAVSYSKLGLYQEAQWTLTEEIRRHPDDQTAYLNLITLYADQDRYAEAAEAASGAVQAFPQSAQIWIVRGAAYTLTGQLDKAYEDFSNAAKLAPDEADPPFFLALTRYKQGRFADAINSVQAANRRGIVDSDLHYLLAECLLKRSTADAQAAMRELDKAIELNPHSVSARSLRGKLLLEAGSTKEALSDLQEAHQRDPGSRTAAYNLARAYQKSGRKQEAQPLFEQIRNGATDSMSELSQRRLSEVLVRRGAQP